MAGLIGVALAGGSAGGAAAQQLPVTNGFVFDGRVDTVTTIGTSTYVGGAFDGQLTPTGGSGLVATAATGDGAIASGAAPAVDGTVAAMTDDGTGGFYLGGTFTTVGGVARRNLAHVKADGSVDPVFNPSPNAAVSALDRVGDRLAVLGAFEAIGGRQFGDGSAGDGLAVLDVATGRATAFTPAATGYPSAIDATGTRIYVQGSLTVAGADRRLVALDLTTGALLPWRTPVEAEGGHAIDAVKAVGGTLVLGVRDYTEHQPSATEDLAGVDTTTGAVKWRIDISPSASPLLVNGGTRLYVVPNSLNAPTGAPFALDPATGRRVWTAAAGLADGFLTAGVKAAYLKGNAIYVVGNVESVGTQDRLGAAAFDVGSGALLPWNPGIGQPGGSAVAGLGARVVVGGGFENAGPVVGYYKDVAKLKADGTLDRTFPRLKLRPRIDPGGFYVDPEVNAFAVSGTTLYVGGSFFGVNGLDRGGIFAVNQATGAILPFATADLLDVQGPTAIRVLGDHVEVTVGAAEELDKTGRLLPPELSYAARVSALRATFDGAFTEGRTATFTAPVAGPLTYTAVIPGTSYVAATATATATTTTKVVKPVLHLTDIGRVIRSVYPDFAFATKAVFRFGTGGPELVSEGTTPTS